MFGAGAVAQRVLSDGNFGSYLAINLGWGIGVTMGIFFSELAKNEFQVIQFIPLVIMMARFRLLELIGE
jgi:glycerol uptake facilitator-like aquaporin